MRKSNGIAKGLVITMKKLTRTGGVLLALLCLLGTTASAAPPGDSYIYDYWDEAVPAPAGYSVARTVNAEQAGTTAFVTPQDLFRGPDGLLYLADTGNNRIVVLDQDCRFVREYRDFTQADGTTTQLNKPNGVFVTAGGELYIADKENDRVLISDPEGMVKGSLLRPESDIFPENVHFKPTKVIVEGSGKAFVLVEGLFYGAVSYDADGRFIGFYGSNRVQLSLVQMADLVWRKLFEEDNKATVERYVPVEFSNLTADKDNYISTCTKAMNTTAKIKKLNVLGLNILHTDAFGDLEVVWSTGGSISDTQFVDLCVDENGFINALDFERGRIFQYDNEGNLMFVTGGKGNQKGLFRMPSAIESVDGKLLVLDADKGNITVFEPTAYAGKVHRAMALYNQGLYEQAIGPWQEVLTLNGNNYYAHASLGKAYYDKGDYTQAMEQFRLGNDRAGYSKAYKEQRTEFIRRHFALFSILLLLLLAGLLLLLKKKKVRAYLTAHGVRLKEPQPKPLKGFRYIGYILRHPVEGYEEMRYRKNGSVGVSLLILLLWFLGLIFSYQMTGFIFNHNRLETLNIGLLFCSSIVPFLLWVVANWCFCTLLNGEGRIKGIFVFSAYALVPYVAALYVTLLLSNVLTLDEGVFSTWLLLLGALYTAFLLFSAIRVLHQYSGGKTIVSILLTLLGMLIVVFLAALAFSLVRQVVTFVMTIVREYTYRVY